MALITTILIAAVGGLSVKALRIPAGAMIGAMAAVAIFNILTGEAFLPTEVKTAVQIIAGAFIGVGIHKEDVIALKKVLLPAVITVASVIILTLLMGFLLYFFTGYDLATSLLSCAPGGVVDMSLISYDMGADSSVVSVLQLLRLISVIALFPPIVSRVARIFGKKHPQEEDVRPVSEKREIRKEKTNWKNVFLTTVIAAAGGMIGFFLGLPAGALVFSMIAVAIQNIFLGNAELPFYIKTGAQICSGALIGEGITLAAVIGLKEAAIPALLFLLGHFLISISMSLGLYRFTKLNLPTAFFCCAPGGLSEFSLIAGDFGADASKVSTFQLLRVVCVIGFYPLIISGLLILFQ